MTVNSKSSLRQAQGNAYSTPKRANPPPEGDDIYRQLTAEGWLDEIKLLPGQEWDIEIEKAVEQADVMIVCLSNKSVDKEGHVQKELRFALNIADEKPEGTIFVVPLRLS